MIKLKAPKEFTKAHRFLKGALKFADINLYYNYFAKLIRKAQKEELNFVDTAEFIPEAVINRLTALKYTVFGSVIRWESNAEEV